MTSKKIHVKLNHVHQHNSRCSTIHTGRDRSDSASSQNDCTLVEFSYSDTFTSLLEKCLLALHVRIYDSSSTTFSNEEQGSYNRNVITK